ncbi:MAG: helix-turn-helix transcriptional regulator [Pseudoclavibacter sp.]|nr:helix-turn-helix transcriptional regulator [Pseudoclavibacter sp.]
MAAVSTGGVRVRALGGRVEIAVEFRFRSSGPVPPAGPDPDPGSLPAVRLLRERTAEGELLRVLVAAPEREPLLAKLSERERQVLAELATGGTNADLAAGLGISAKTLQNHLGSIYRKLGVSGRAGAVAALGGEPSGWPP